MANNFEYKIHVSIDQTGLQNDVKKALSDMAKEVKNNAYKIEFNGDYSSLIKQLVDLQKQIPNIDLTKGLEFHLSDKIREDSELGKTLIKELSTHVVNSMKEMMTSVDGIKKSISESSQLLDKLKSRRKELYDDKSITNATEAYEAAEKRFIEASSKLEKAGQDKTRVAAIDEMKKSYQDMINLEKEANKEASKSQTITNMGIMAEQADQEYKIAKDKYIKLSEIRKELLETKPTHNSYAEMLGDIDSQILSTENRLTELKKNLETAEHPELQIHGKLADDFLTDLQSQLDNLQGLEVKVTPKVDKDAKIELKADVKTDIENHTGNINPTVKNIGEQITKKKESTREISHELEDVQQKLDNIQPQKTQEEVRAEFEKTRSEVSQTVSAQEGYFESLYEKAKTTKLSYEEVIAVVNEAEKISSQFAQHKLEIQDTDFSRYDGKWENYDIKFDGLKANSEDFKQSLTETYKLYKNVESAIKNNAGMYKGIKYDPSDLEELKGVFQILSSYADNLGVDINSVINSIPRMTKEFKELATSSVEQSRAVEENNRQYDGESEELKNINEKLQQRYNLLEKIVTLSVQGNISKVIDVEDTLGGGVLSNFEDKDFKYGDVQTVVGHICKLLEIDIPSSANKAKEALTEVNTTASTPPDISGQDKEQAELTETAQKADEATEAIKREKEAASQSVPANSVYTGNFSKDVENAIHSSEITKPSYEQFNKGEYNQGKKELEEYYNRVVELQTKLNSFSTDTPESEIEELKGEVYAAKVEFIAAYDVLNNYSDYRLDKASKSGGAKNSIQNMYKSIIGEQKEQNIKNAYSTSREIDDWIDNNVNRQMYPPVVDYVSSEEEIQRAINKITEYKTKLEEISKSDYFGELSANMQSEIQNTITYLGNLITTEEKVLETSRRMTEATTGDINTQQTESHTEKLEQEAEAARDATDAINEKNNAEQQTNNTPTTTTSQLEREYEAREKNVIAINEQAEAERALRESSIVPTTELLASELEKVNEITSSSTPNPKLDSIQQDIQEDIQEAEKLSDALGNITTDFNGAPVDVNRRTVYGKDKEGNEVQASMYSVRGEGFTATLNEEAEVVEMNTQILHGYTQAQNEATAAREDATRVGKSLNQMETESANEVSKAYQKLISDQEKYEASLKKTASAEAKQNWKDTQKEYYANLTKQVKEYIALKEKIASGNGIDEDKQKVDELENTWMQLVDTITNNGFFNKGMESKALSGIDGLESRLSQISTDVLTKNIAKLAEYQAAKEKALGQGYSENETYIQYLDSEINKLEEVNAKLRSNISTTEQETAVKNAEAEAEAKVAKQKEANAIAAQKVSDAGKKENQVLDKTRAQLLNQASALTTNGKLMEAYGDKVRAFLQEIQNTGTTKERLEQIRIELTKISSEATLAGKSGKTLGQILSGRAKSLVAYLSTFASFYRIVSYVRTAISTIKELDTQLVDLRKTTTMTSSELEQFYHASSDVAKQLGVTSSEIIQQAANWSRLGYSTKEAATEMAKLSSQFATISPGMDTETAQQGLVSIMKSWKLDVADVESEIMDKINTLGNNFAESNEDIVQGMERSSAALAAVGTSYEDAFALFTGGQEILQNAEKMGTGLRSVGFRIRGVSEETEEADEELKNITGDLIELTKTAEHQEGVSIFKPGSTTEYKSLVDYFREIHNIWDEMSQKQQNDFLTKAFGKVQAQTGAAIITNFEQVEEALKKMENSAGSADREMNIVESSISFKLNRLRETWVSTLTDVIQRDTFGNTVDNLTNISEALGGVISKIGLLKTAIIGIGTVIGSQKLGLFGLLKGNTSGIKNTVQSINQLSQAGKSVRDVNNAVKGMSGLTTNIAVGNIVDVTAVEKYRDAMAGLSVEQQALALSSAGLNAEQAKVVLTYNEGALASTALSEAEATRVLTEAGLVSTIVTLNAEETASLATKVGLSEAVLQQSLVEAGAITTEEEEIIVTNQLNQEHLKAILINHGLVDSEAELVAGYIADTVAKKAATAGTIEFAGATNLLTGALSKLKAVLLAHPIAAILAGIATATVLVVSSVKKHAEEIKKIADEAVDNYESTMNRLISGKKSFDELSKEYAELSKGVDSLGNNVSLTTDEYENYHEVANQLANITPSLVKAWDDQGNAILSVKSNVEELTEAYKKEQEEARTSLMGKTDEILENSKRSVKEIEHDMGSMDNYGERLDELSKLIQKTDFTLEDLSFFDNGGFEYHGNYGVTTQYDQLTDLLRNAGIKDSYKYNTGSGLVDYFTNISDTDKARLQAFIKEEKAAYTESLKQRKELVDAYFKDALFGEYDSKISDNVKSSISNIIDTIDNDTLKSLDSAESIQEFVDKLLTPFTNLSDENQDKLELGVRLTTEWNNNEISYEEYVQKIQDFNALLEELFPGDENAETRRTFKILFDIPEDEELKSQVSTITNRRERVLYNKGSNPYEGVQKTEGQKQGSKVYDEWVQGLKTEDQAFVSKLSEESLELTIDFTTEKDFNQWLEELQAEADKHKITLTTDLVSDLDTFEDKIDSLATAYESAVTNGKYVEASDLQSLNDDFGGMKDDDGNYTAMASSIENYNDRITQNIGKTDEAQAATDDLLTSYLDLSGTLEDLIDEGEDYAKQVLKNQGVENAEEVVTSRLNKTYKTTRANLVALTKALNQETSSNTKFLDVLESGIRSGTDFEETCAGLVDSVKQLVAVYNQETGEVEGTFDDIIDSKFIADNIEDVIGLFNGVEGSLDSLYAKVAALNAEQVWIDAGLDDTELDSKMTSIRAMLDIASTWTMEPEALLEDSQFMSALNDCWDSSVETANAINAALSTIGMKVQYKKTTNKIRVAKGSDSNAHTVYGGANAGKVMTADIIEVDDFEIVATPTGKGTTGSNANYTGSPSSSSNSGGSGDGSDSSSDSEETFDWIEVAIDRLENNLDKLSETIDDTYDDWESRNEAIKKSIDEVNKEIGLQQEGAEEYLKKAESIDLSEDWKRKVREGKIEIDTVTDDTLKTNIQNYQTWLFFSHHTYCMV